MNQFLQDWRYLFMVLLALAVYLFLLFFLPPVALVFLVGLGIKLGLMLWHTHHGSSHLIYLSDDIVRRTNVFLKVFSCPLPANLTDLSLLKFLVPLTIELLPLSNELRLFFYSQDVKELHHRCQLASRNLLRSIPLLKPVSSSQLKTLLVDPRLLTGNGQSYIEQRNKVYVCYHASEASAKLIDFFRWYSQEHGTGELRIVLPFISQPLLTKTTSPWLSTRFPNASDEPHFRGVEVYVQLTDPLDPQTLQPVSDSRLASQVQLRYPTHGRTALPTDAGLRCLVELLRVMQRQKHASDQEAEKATQVPLDSLVTENNSP